MEKFFEFIKIVINNISWIIKRLAVLVLPTLLLLLFVDIVSGGIFNILGYWQVLSGLSVQTTAILALICAALWYVKK